MTKIVKSISLDAQTAPMANEKENFSRWVREQLLSEIQYTQPCVYFEVRHTDRFGKVIFDPDPENPKNKKMRVTKEICNGQKKPTCPKCYPEGPPEREDWLLYAGGRITKSELLDRASQTWKWRTDQINEKTAIPVSKKLKNDPQSRGSKPKRAYVRRLLVWIWSFIW